MTLIAEVASRASRDIYYTVVVTDSLGKFASTASRGIHYTAVVTDSLDRLLRERAVAST